MTQNWQEIPLARPVPSVLAVGAYLKNTICVTKGANAYLSLIHDDLGTPKAIAAFEHSVETMLADLGVKPVAIAHDLHPDFYSTRFAQSFGRPALAVQHHHAHGLAIAAEHQLTKPFLAVSLDGFGLGPNHESWGGELLLVDGLHYQRLGHFAHLAQPGGDVAAVQPWRMAASALHALGRAADIPARFSYPASGMIGAMLERGVNSPRTSSAGRLFDAACGLLGVHEISEYEGQAPMALEAMVETPRVMSAGFTLENGILDFLPLLAALDGLAPKDGAELFHGTLIEGISQWCQWAAKETGLNTIALGGGCFFNRVLLTGLKERLAQLGLNPLSAQQVSPGDPAISLGQAWAAALWSE